MKPKTIAPSLKGPTFSLRKAEQRDEQRSNKEKRCGQAQGQNRERGKEGHVGGHQRQSTQNMQAGTIGTQQG
jgi:hypothetical protein